MNKERFQPSGINNLPGCQKPIDPYPCVNKRIGPSIQYPLENQNYDLMRDTYHWSKYQFQPDLLLPQIRQYKQLSGRDNCYVNTANQRSTLYNANCFCEESKASNDKEKFTNLTPEARLDWPGCLTGYETTRSILTDSYPRSILDDCTCDMPSCDLSGPPDIQKAKNKEKFSNLLTEHREAIRDSSFAGYFYDEMNVSDVYRYFLPSIAYDLPGYDSNELQETPCL